MFEPGDRVFMPGAAGEPKAIAASVLASAGIDLWTTFVPGVNRIDPDAIGPGTNIRGLFGHRNVLSKRPEAFSAVPMSYGAFLRFVREGDPFDAVVVQVAPPDEGGFCSLGPLVEFSELALNRAKRRIAVINPEVRPMANGPRIRAADCEMIDGGKKPLPTYGGEPDPVSRRIAAHVVQFIDDGSALQMGLGKVPPALATELVSRRRLRLHSGMLSDGVIALHAAGALDSRWPHRTTALLGSNRLYDWAANCDHLYIVGADGIHDARVLAGIDRLIAVNSALSVDLAGQCNLEVAGGVAVSGPGGAPDFARAAALSPGGCSIVALPATLENGESRIVIAFPAGVPSSLSRADVDIVVTEEGAADLRGKSPAERASALIAIAAPAVREDLERAWRLQTFQGEQM
ncbi:MAG TPA: acetyl-CoA hydrolase/transferase C-terminal domain-containing protein [Sphingomicrobium sp.]|nr:acetyl-CoA hydrolase/transferase C-terminal domain-containing protein [Sphingomicrobium sp.]